MRGEELLEEYDEHDDDDEREELLEEYNEHDDDEREWEDEWETRGRKRRRSSYNSFLDSMEHCASFSGYLSAGVQ